MNLADFYTPNSTGDTAFSVVVPLIKLGLGSLREIGADAKSLKMKSVAVFTDPYVGKLEPVADRPIGVKALNITFAFETLGEVFVFNKATVEVLLHIPIVKPITRILITTLASEHKPILR